MVEGRTSLGVAAGILLASALAVLASEAAAADGAASPTAVAPSASSVAATDPVPVAAMAPDAAGAAQPDAIAAAQPDPSGAAAAADPDVDGNTFPVPPPPITEGYFPCSTCHGDIPPNYQRRKLVDEHTDIVLDHGPRERWCFDCHDPVNRDRLHLASGVPVPFTASYRLCGQCHGDKYRDWRVGVHGKRTGSWSGAKMYLLCANCHDPHSPHFKPLRSMPPPSRPAAIH